MPKDKDILVKMGEILSQKAKAKFKSNLEFADVAGIGEGTVRRILNGDQNVSIKLLQKACDALGIKMSDLLKEAGH